MALRMSTGLRNAMLSGTNSSFRALFAGGILRLYTGSLPASPDSAVTGSLVCTFSAGTFGTTGTAGTVSIAPNTVSGTCGIAGTIGYFRFSESSDGGTASTTTSRIDGTVDKPDTVGADLTLVNTIVLKDQVLSVVTASIGFPVS
jgi:hypothetical protein